MSHANSYLMTGTNHINNHLEPSLQHGVRYNSQTSDTNKCWVPNCNVCKFLTYSNGEPKNLGDDSTRLSNEFLRLIRQSIDATKTILSESNSLLDLGKVERSLVHKKLKAVAELASNISKKFRDIRKRFYEIQKSNMAWQHHQMGQEMNTLHITSPNYDTADCFAPLVDWWAELGNKFMDLSRKFEASKQVRLALLANQKSLDVAREECIHYQDTLSIYLSRQVDSVQAELASPHWHAAWILPAGSNIQYSPPPQDHKINEMANSARRILDRKLIGEDILRQQFLEAMHRSIGTAETVFIQSTSILNLGQHERPPAQNLKDMQMRASDVYMQFRNIRRGIAKTRRFNLNGGAADTHHWHTGQNIPLKGYPSLPTFNLGTTQFIQAADTINFDDDIVACFTLFVDWWAQLANRFTSLCEKSKGWKHTSNREVGHQLLLFVQEECGHYKHQISAVKPHTTKSGIPSIRPAGGVSAGIYERW